jgi:glycosyltransferase involved in cell wall biosynthesis
VAPPEISVVVPVRNGAGSLPALLNSLAAQDLEADRYEVVVVDNASTDRSAEVAASHDARVEFEPVPNRSRARNAGVSAARAQLLAFIDADCTASPTWLSALLNCRGTAPLVAGNVEIETRKPPNAIERFESSWRFNQESAVTQGWAATANLMVERHAFDAVGGFDSRYWYGEDVDFCLRARRLGYSLTLCLLAVVRHRAEHNLHAVFRRAFLHGYGASQVLHTLGVGHVAWRHPRPLVSPRMALAFHGVSPDSLPRRDRVIQSGLATAAYASRVAGSAWASLLRTR